MLPPAALPSLLAANCWFGFALPPTRPLALALVLGVAATRRAPGVATLEALAVGRERWDKVTQRRDGHGDRGVTPCEN
jgi:hypothetical protein